MRRFQILAAAGISLILAACGVQTPRLQRRGHRLLLPGIQKKLQRE